MRGLAGWQSEVQGHLGGKSEELERLAIEMYARGLSMRDIEAAFTVDGVAEKLHLGQRREAVLAT